MKDNGVHLGMGALMIPWVYVVSKSFAAIALSEDDSGKLLQLCGMFTIDGLHRGTSLK